MQPFTHRYVAASKSFRWAMRAYFPNLPARNECPDSVIAIGKQMPTSCDAANFYTGWDIIYDDSLRQDQRHRAEAASVRY